MSSQLLGSKTTTQEEQAVTFNIPSLNTAVAGVAMVTQRGPIGVATRCASREDFVRIFGSHHANSDSMAYIDAFFANGGTEVWVVRVVHYTDVTNPASKTSAQASLTLSTAAIAAQSGHVDGTVVGPFNFEPADTLKVKVDGAGALTATFNAIAAARESAAQPFALVNNGALTVAIDGGVVQTVTFTTGQFVAIGAATALEVAAVINASIVGAKATVTSGGTKVTITSDRRGTGSGVNVTGGSSNGVLAYTTGNLAGTGNVSNIDAVTVAEVKTVVEAAVAGVTVSSSGGKAVITRNTTGAAASVQIDGTGTTQTIIGLDLAVHAGVNSGTLSTLQVQGKTDGTYANGISVKIAAASSGNADEFNLTVVDSTGTSMEPTFTNLSMTDTAVRFVETVLNAESDAGGSRFIVVTDQDATTPSPNDVPAIGTFGPLTGGADGLASLADADFIGSSAADPKTGMAGLEDVETQTLLMMPGQTTSAIENAMLAYCEVTRAGQVFAVMGPPAGLSTTGVVTYFKSTAALKGLSEMGAFYWPRVKVSNPNSAIYGTVKNITLDPCMHVAGAISRVDNSRQGGVYEPPAGLNKAVLFGVLELEKRVVTGDSNTDLVYPEGINPITIGRGQSAAIAVDGTKTIKLTGNWPQVQQRRGVSFIERSLQLAVDPVARHNSNTPQLRKEVARGCDQFLVDQKQFGAFAKEKKEECFFVDFGDPLNPSSQPNTMTGRIGVNMGKSTDYVVLKFGRLNV